MKTTSLLFILLVVFILSACKKDSESLNPVTEQPTSFKLNKSTLSLAQGGREKLLIIVTPTDATISNATWSIEDKAIATIDKDGLITPVSAGNTIVTLTVGDKTEQCALQVVESPVSNLIMPEVKYPIATGATILLQGSGFTIGNKIWLRKNDNSGGGLKSSQTDPDILATILEQTEAYLTFTSTATDGWYSLLLDNNTTKFNLGNIQIETQVVPEFAYDKTKIFWEDTHWRRFQLRGKVKEMTITEIGNTGKYKSIYKFNQTGLLESFVSDNHDSVVYKYDNQNRMTNIIFYQGLSNNYHISETWDYTYGTHEMYYPVDFRVAYDCYYGAIYEFANYEIWVKGLTGIRHEYSYQGQYSLGIVQFEVSSNSIIVTGHSTDQPGSNSHVANKDIYTYNGAFPIIEEQWHYSSNDTIHGYSNFQFSSTGMPIKKSYTSAEGVHAYDYNYFENSPYALVSSFVYGSGGEDEYDKNWNLIKHTTGSIYSRHKYSINYVSYDKTGNWTACNINEKTDGPEGWGWGSQSAWSETRDITYW